MVMGLESGDGVVILFAASEDEARGGMFMSRGASFLVPDCCSMGLLEAEGEDGAGLPVAILVGSRLVP